MTQYATHNKDEYSRNCVTGDKNHLYYHLKELIRTAEKIDIIVAFLMESGVRLLVNDLKEAILKGAKVRILSGNYLNITQPQALYLLKDELGDDVDLRFYNVPNRSFHPKAYIFEMGSHGEIFVGSSNISRSALTNGIEWNYRISSKTSPEDYNHFKQTFEDLFINHSIIVNDVELRRYSKNWSRPRVFEDLEKIENGTDESGKIPGAAETAVLLSKDHKVIKYPFPKGAQIEALYELKKFRLDGGDRGLIVAATGVGKTFLAAFDSKEYSRILFVAHREEILSQAERTFQCVHSDKTIGYFSGNEKETSCDITLATVQTLGREEYLNEDNFLRDYFNYIVIDEFHHAVAGNYINILDYFKPKFLLGLTATPERLDNQDVFALCDYNLIYEVRLKEAINKGWLTPFRYYGVYDETNYNEIDYRNGRYDEKQLEKLLSLGKRVNLILQHYQKYNSKRALGFCSSRRHAVYMAEYFNDHGIPSCAVISGNNHDRNGSQYILERDKAIKALFEAKIKVLFSVDMFNEGLDIPEVDLVMFLRPTESPTVFLQQLGRGLRRSIKKKYVNVLDFIGNYKKANLVPYFLTGDIKDYKSLTQRIVIPGEEDYPENCMVNFDFRLVDLFKKMANSQKDLFTRIKDEYDRIGEVISERPLRLAMYTFMDDGLYQSIRVNNNLNIFKDYLSFLKKINELTDNERTLIGTFAHDFLKEIEKTGMTKLYKMPVLLAFYNEGNIKIEIDEHDIAESFKTFYAHGSNAIDMLKDKGTRNFKAWGLKEYADLAYKNPVHFLSKSASKFFYPEGTRFCINSSLKPYLDNPEFIRHFKDVIDYRTRRFYKERLQKQLESQSQLFANKPEDHKND